MANTRARDTRAPAREEPPPPDPEEVRRQQAEHEAFLKECLRRSAHVMGLLAPPPDAPLLKKWIEAGADFEEIILPIIERVSEKFIAKGQPPKRFALFAPDVRAKVLETREEDRQFWEWMKIEDDGIGRAPVLRDFRGDVIH